MAKHEKAGRQAVPAASGARRFSRRKALYGFGLAGAGVLAAGWGLGLFSSPSASAVPVVVYKSPSCGCCGEWVRHMRRNGYRVEVHDLDDVDPVKRRAGVPESLESCHTAFIGDYVIEGHVPAQSIARLLAEGPPVKGLAVPGMPVSAPGMDGPGNDPYEVMAFAAKGGIKVYERY